MIILKRNNFLKDSPEYEDYTKNVAILSDKEKEELGIRTCKCSCKKKMKK